MAEGDNGGKVDWRDLTSSVDKLREDTNKSIKDLRDEQRRDMNEMEDRLMNAFKTAFVDFRSQFDKYQADHLSVHQKLETDGTRSFQKFKETEKVDLARTKGRIDVLRGTLAVMDALNKYKIVLTIVLAFILFITGNADIDLSGK